MFRFNDFSRRSVQGRSGRAAGEDGEDEEGSCDEGSALRSLYTGSSDTVEGLTRPVSGATPFPGLSKRSQYCKAATALSISLQE